MRTLPLVGTLLLAFAVGCGTSNGKTDSGTVATTDAGHDAGSSGDAGTMSACGHPGDMGNSMGVGQYCDSNTPCTNASAICSTVEAELDPDSGNPPTNFCTIPGCTACETAATTTSLCGENSFCACNSLGCGCAPSSCSALATPTHCDGG